MRFKVVFRASPAVSLNFCTIWRVNNNIYLLLTYFLKYIFQQTLYPLSISFKYYFFIISLIFFNLFLFIPNNYIFQIPSSYIFKFSNGNIFKFSNNYIFSIAFFFKGYIFQMVIFFNSQIFQKGLINFKINIDMISFKLHRILPIEN